jgi:hypothetical protein
MSTQKADRPVKEVTIKDGLKIVLYEYLTGRDRRQIEGVYMGQSTVSRKTDQDKKTTVEIGGVSGTVGSMMQDKTIELIVKEIHSGEEIITDRKAVLDFILDLPENEYDDVMVAIEELTTKKA